MSSTTMETVRIDRRYSDKSNRTNQRQPSLMDLPLDILLLIADEICRQSYVTTALEVTVATRRRAITWPRNLLDSQKRELQEADAVNIKADVEHLAHRDALHDLLNLRLVNRFWAERGAEILVKWSHASQGVPRRGHSCLNLRLTQSSLDFFLTIANNRVLAKAMRFIQIEDVLSEPLHVPGLAAVTREYLPTKECPESAMTRHDVEGESKEVPMIEALYKERQAMLGVLLLDRRDELISSIKQLTRVECLEFCLDLQLRAYHAYFRTPPIRQTGLEHSAFRSLVMDAFISAREEATRV